MIYVRPSLSPQALTGTHILHAGLHEICHGRETVLWKKGTPADCKGCGSETLIRRRGDRYSHPDEEFEYRRRRKESLRSTC
jgi:hypothetical protein